MTLDPVGVIGDIFGGVAMIAAILAAIYAALAPSRKDLQRVEQNTADTAEGLEKVRTHIGSVDTQLKEQRFQAEAESAARRVSISVAGKQDGPAALLSIVLTVKDPTVTLVDIELRNEAGTLFGTSPCTSLEPLKFAAVIEASTAQRWFNSSVADQHADHRRAVVRAALLLNEREAHREFAVYLHQKLTSVPGSMVYLLSIDGAC